MSDLFMISLNTLAPIFFYFVIGYVVKNRGIIDSHTVSRMMKMTNQVFLPVLLFHNIISSAGNTALPWKIIGIAALSSTIACGMAMLISVMGLLDRVSVNYVDSDLSESYFMNCNTPEEYEDMLRFIGEIDSI